MIIEVDSNFLVKHNLTIKEYLFCYLLYKGANYQLSKYLKKDAIDLPFLKKLENKEWIKKIDKNNLSAEITEKFSSLFTEKDYFQELIDTFPKNVIRQDGTKSYLRTAQKECKRRYSRIIKNSRLKHDKIINALKTEIDIKTSQNKMMWFKTLSNWLKAEEWLAYEDVDIDNNSLIERNNSYGTDIL